MFTNSQKTFGTFAVFLICRQELTLKINLKSKVPSIPVWGKKSVRLSQSSYKLDEWLHLHVHRLSLCASCCCNSFLMLALFYKTNHCAHFQATIYENIKIYYPMFPRRQSFKQQKRCQNSSQSSMCFRINVQYNCCAVIQQLIK